MKGPTEGNEEKHRRNVDEVAESIVKSMDRKELLARVNLALYTPKEAKGVELGGAEKKVLRALSIEGLMTGYDLHSRKRLISSSTWHYARRDLVEKGLIELKKKEPFERIKGKCRKFYGPTATGLVVAIENLDWEDDPREDLKKIAKNWGDFSPLIFKNWHDFLKKGLEQEALHILYEAAYWFNRLDLPYSQDMKSLAFQFARRFYGKVLDTMFPAPSYMAPYLPEDILSKHEKEIAEECERLKEKWLDLFATNPELQGFLKIILDGKVKKLREAISDMESLTVNMKLKDVD